MQINCCGFYSLKVGDIIGRILVVEFKDEESNIFDEIMDTLKRYPNFDHLRLDEETVVSLPGLEIYPDRRKIYRDREEIGLTTKEFEILCMLVANKGRVLTYEQIYQRIWGEDALGNENNAVGCHIRNLREKLYEASPNAPFTIRCIREVGYCFELEKN